MTLSDAIKARRSIRKFQSRPVPADFIEKLVAALRLAPSAYNAQPVKLMIISDAALKEKLKAERVFRQDFVYDAPLIIVCCADPGAFPEEKFDPVFSRVAEIGGEVGAVRDLSLGAQNLVLMATDLGLGSCYIGVIDRPKLKALLNIPAAYVLPFVIIAGFPDEEAKPLVRKDVKEYLM